MYILFSIVLTINIIHQATYDEVSKVMNYAKSQLSISVYWKE